MQMDGAHGRGEACRGELLKAGVGFPGETAEEAACRLRRQFDLLSEGELAALAGVDLPTLRKWREVRGPRARQARLHRPLPASRRGRMAATARGAPRHAVAAQAAGWTGG